MFPVCAKACQLVSVFIKVPLSARQSAARDSVAFILAHYPRKICPNRGADSAVVRVLLEAEIVQQKLVVAPVRLDLDQIGRASCRERV